MIKIFEVTEMSQKVYDAFERLLPQLSSSAKIPTWDELSDLIASKAGIVLAAVDDEDPEEKILGTMTLVVFRIPTGVREIKNHQRSRTFRKRGSPESLPLTHLLKTKLRVSSSPKRTKIPSFPSKPFSITAVSVF